jgi:hypothetical protein
LKAKIVKNIRLERDVLLAKLHKEYCESLFATVELYLEALGKNPAFAIEMVLALLQQHGDFILKHVTMPQEEFTALYRTVLNVPPITQASASLVRQRDIIKRALTQFFSATWDIFTKHQRDK